jgi:uncharacterized RDD family membrane protein YckC
MVNRQADTERTHPTRRDHLHTPVRREGVPVLVLLLVLWMTPASFAEWPGLRAVGGKDSLWVMYEANGEHGQETRVWERQIDQGFFRPRRLDRQPPGIVAAAVCGDSLHLIFDDGAHRRIGRRRTSPQVVLPGRAKPLCLAGDMTEDVLYAVVASAAATNPPEVVPSTQALRSKKRPVSGPSPFATPVSSGPATRPASSTVAHTRDLAPGTVPSMSCTMYRFRLGEWVSLGAMPDWFRPDDSHLMCANAGQVQLFWWEPRPRTHVWCGRWSKDEWGVPEAVPIPAGAIPAAAMVVNTYLVLVTKTPVGQGRCVVTFHSRVGDRWRSAELRASGDTPIELSANRLQIAPYHGAMAVVGQLGKKGQLQAGLWSPVDGTLVEPIRSLPKWPEPAASRLQPRLPQVAVVMVLGAVLALTFWWRQESLIRPVSLPANVELASLWRRLAACIIDMIPAVAITAVYWLPMLMRSHQDIASESLTEAEALERFAVMQWPWLYIRAIYAVTCGLAEYRWGTTLGKRLMQLWVTSLELTPPTPRQIIIRNTLRVLELQPDLIALLIFILLTRNRQRLGDVLAGTIVIEPKWAQPE